MSLDLTLETHQTNAGPYTITFGRKEAPLDVQEAAFSANGLGMVSPAQLGFLRVTQREGDTTFNCYSKTDAYVFYDDRRRGVWRRRGQVVIVPNSAISRLVDIADLVNAHRQQREYVIPQERRESIYALVDEMLKNGTAIVARYGETRVRTSKFGRKDLTSKLFSDEKLGIKAQDYGDWLGPQGRTEQCFLFDEKDHAKAQGGPYLSRLRLYGVGGGFIADGVNWSPRLDGGAFGVRFEKAAAGCAQQR